MCVQTRYQVVNVGFLEPLQLLLLLQNCLEVHLVQFLLLLFFLLNDFGFQAHH